MSTETTAQSPPFNETELAAWRGLLQLHAGITRELDAQMHAEHGISLSAYEVLMFLADAPEHRLRMNEIAERVLLSRSGCTRLVDRLEQTGLVTRHSVEGDKRGFYAELTEQGVELITGARSTHREGVRKFFLDHLSATDQLALADIWSRVNGS